MNKQKLLLVLSLIVIMFISFSAFAETQVQIKWPNNHQHLVHNNQIAVTADVYDTVSGAVYSGIQWYYDGVLVEGNTDTQTFVLGTVGVNQKQTHVIKAVYNGMFDEINVNLYNELVIINAVNYVKTLQTDEGSFQAWCGHNLAASLGDAGIDLRILKKGTNSYVDYLKLHIDEDGYTSSNGLITLINTLASIGENPRNFDGKDIVKRLLDKQQENGSFGATSEYSEAMAVIGLHKAGVTIPKQAELRDYFEGLTYRNGLVVERWNMVSEDSTAAIVRALKILGADNNHPIIQGALDAFQSSLSPEGIIVGSWGPNYDTTSEVVMMLADLGINPTQGVWNKNGKTPISAILSNQDANGSFKNEFSTYEALSALTKYYYTFNSPLSSGNSNPGGPSGSGSNVSNSITVKVSVVGKNGEVLYPKASISISADSKFGSTALQALEQTGLPYKTKNDNSYVYEIAGLKEDISSTAGWKFKVNGVTPNTAAKNCTLNNGDEVVWFWVQDYMQDQPDSGYVEDNPEIIPASPEIIDSNEIQVVFTDVTDNEYGWAKDEIQYLAARGIVNGTGNGKYDPEKPITREEFIKIIIAMMGEEIGDSVSTGFKDEGYISVWARSYIAKAKELGIINGYEDNSFRPKENITREEMIVILMRALIKQKKIELLPSDDKNLPFNDIETASSWARNYISAAVHNNIVKGRSDNLFDAKSGCIRAEAAVAVYRAMNI